MLQLAMTRDEYESRERSGKAHADAEDQIKATSLKERTLLASSPITT